MSTKAKEKDQKTPVLKGQDAEDKILNYMKQCNRPYGAVDVAANLKGAVPKAATQKILVALAEKGDLIQKTYGKTTFFVYNQHKLPALPNEKITELKTELGHVEESNKTLAAKIKALAGELAIIRTTLTNDDIVKQTSEMEASISRMRSTLEPLRSGAPPISAEELKKLVAEVNKWRSEWVHRRKVFITFWQLATDSLVPQEAKELEEELGIEKDSSEHLSLEKKDFIQKINVLKRKSVR
ncbi:TBPIP-domain-containing protein [Panaeolus papilionaceus]|nr:TBPIP-domain-containing protein [Panaeolus papilionaceus]